jgi:hypothetical protein
MQPNSMVANDDTLLYFSRAWKLGLKSNTLLDHPDLQQVQIEGLLAIFLLALGHVNRYQGMADMWHCDTISDCDGAQSTQREQLRDTPFKGISL